jgi:hypothetical protein
MFLNGRLPSFSQFTENMSGILLRINSNVFRDKSFEFQRGNSLRKQLVQLFQTPSSRLGHKEEHVDDDDEIRCAPDIPLFRTPVEGGGIDEIGGTKRDEPSENKVDARPKRHCPGTKTLGWHFRLNRPHHRALTHIVYPRIDNATSDECLQLASPLKIDTFPAEIVPTADLV